MSDCSSPIYPTTPSDHELEPSRGLLDQRVFYYDQTGYECLVNQQADVLIQAIALAHRLIFSPKSLWILNFYLGTTLATEVNLPEDWVYGFNPHIESALDALAIRDGMQVVLDRKTHQDGFVRIKEPKVLRVNATLVEQAIRTAKLPAENHHLHLFHLASVLAHLICRSIRLMIAGPGHIGDWTWEVEYFGGFIERNLSPDPYERITSLVVAFHTKTGEGYNVLSPGVLQNLIEGDEGWEVHLPLWSPSSRLVLGRHRDQVGFRESRAEEEEDEVVYDIQSSFDRPEYHCGRWKVSRKA